MRPAIRAGVVLQSALLIGERERDGLTGTHAASRVLPLAIATVIAHIHVLLCLARNRIMNDHVASRPATGLEPELRRTAADVIHAFDEGAGAGDSRRRRW